MILVGVDGSEYGDRALTVAAGLAATAGRRLVVVHVAHTPAVVAAAPTVGAGALVVSADELADHCHIYCELALAPTSVAWSFEVRHGSPAAELLRAAYAHWGLLDRADGGVQLACLPDTEAAIFEVSGTPDGAPAAWAHLPSLHAPAMIIAGDRSFLPLTMFEQQATHARLPLEVVPGGHFLLQEDSDEAADLLRRQGGSETP